MHPRDASHFNSKAFLCATALFLALSHPAKSDEVPQKSFKEFFFSRISLAKDDELIDLINKNKETIQKFNQRDATETLEHTIVFKNEDTVFAKLIEVSPQWLNLENRFGKTPVEIAASRANLAILAWIEKKYSANYLFQQLRGTKIPLNLLTENHELESFDFLNKHLDFFSTPDGSEELKKYADYLAEVLLGDHAYYDDEDDWSDQNKRVKLTGKLLLKYPNIINLLPDFFTEKLFASFKDDFLGTSATDALLVALMKPSKQKDLFDIFKKNPHQIAFYAKQRTIAMFMALFPTPSRAGLPDYDHYGVYLPLQNFYRDIAVLADEKEKTTALRGLWSDEVNLENLDEYIIDSWATFFNVLSNSVSKAEIINSPEWNFNEYVLVLESYLHTLGACNRIQQKASAGNNSELQINHLKENVLPQYRQFIFALGANLAKQQEKDLGFPLSEASLIDLVTHQIKISDGLKKNELSLLLAQLQQTNIFPHSTADNSTADYSQKALQYLQASMQTLRPQIQARRLKQETAKSN